MLMVVDIWLSWLPVLVLQILSWYSCFAIKSALTYIQRLHYEDLVYTYVSANSAVNFTDIVKSVFLDIINFRSDTTRILQI